jgi:HSP20 family protein
MRSQNLPMARHEMRGAGGPFDLLQERIDRMFDEFGLGMPMLRSMGDGTELMPLLDMRDEGDKTIVTAELPGMDEKDIDIALDGDMLTISGEKKSEVETRDHNGGYRSERSFGRFSRTVRLPFSADADKVDARYDKGVLKLSIQRPAEARTQMHRIEIRH